MYPNVNAWWRRTSVQVVAYQILRGWHRRTVLSMNLCHFGSYLIRKVIYKQCCVRKYPFFYLVRGKTEEIYIPKIRRKQSEHVPERRCLAVDLDASAWWRKIAVIMLLPIRSKLAPKNSSIYDESATWSGKVIYITILWAVYVLKNSCRGKKDRRDALRGFGKRSASTSRNEKIFWTLRFVEVGGLSDPHSYWDVGQRIE